MPLQTMEMPNIDLKDPKTIAAVVAVVVIVGLVAAWATGYLTIPGY
jgi:hypothetical protein